jgi:hypothetical protein
MELTISAAKNRSSETARTGDQGWANGRPEPADFLETGYHTCGYLHQHVSRLVSSMVVLSVVEEEQTDFVKAFLVIVQRRCMLHGCGNIRSPANKFRRGLLFLNAREPVASLFGAQPAQPAQHSPFSRLSAASSVAKNPFAIRSPANKFRRGLLFLNARGLGEWVFGDARSR